MIILQARDAAAKALAARTRQILGAMNVRKKYDKSALKSLTTMMRVMMGTNLLTLETRTYAFEGENNKTLTGRNRQEFKNAPGCRPRNRLETGWCKVTLRS